MNKTIIIWCLLNFLCVSFEFLGLLLRKYLINSKKVKVSYLFALTSISWSCPLTQKISFSDNPVPLFRETLKGVNIITILFNHDNFKHIFPRKLRSRSLLCSKSVFLFSVSDSAHLIDFLHSLLHFNLLHGIMSIYLSQSQRSKDSNHKSLDERGKNQKDWYA